VCVHPLSTSQNLDWSNRLISIVRTTGWRSWQDRIVIAELLLDAGANIDAQDEVRCSVMLTGVLFSIGRQLGGHLSGEEHNVSHL
jgi:hypothetical protein